MQGGEISYNDYYEDVENNNSKNVNNSNIGKKILIIIITIIVTLLLIFGIFVLIKYFSNGNQVQTIYFKNEIIELGVGETRNIELVIDAKKPKKIPITWSSSDSEIAVISNGKVIAIKEGTVTITAQYIGKDKKEFIDECQVIISDYKKNIKFEVSNSNWSNKDVTIALKNNSQLEIAELKYALNCNEKCDYKTLDSNSIIISEEGKNSVNVIATMSNNTVIEDIIDVKIDKTKPLAELSDKKTTFSGTNEVEVCVLCTDSGSGCKNKNVCKKYTKSQSNVKIAVSDNAGNTTSSASFNVIIKNDTTQNEKGLCTFKSISSSKITIGQSLDVYLECSDDKGINDINLVESNFSFSKSGIVKISKIARQSITNGYKYTISINGIKEGESSITLNKGVVKSKNNMVNKSVTSGNIVVSKSCTIKPACGCEQYDSWFLKGNTSLSGSCDAAPGGTSEYQKWVNCKKSGGGPVTCSYKCEYYERSCSKYKCC